MRYEKDGFTLWLGEADTPAPMGVLQKTDRLLRMAVRPIDMSYHLMVACRKNDGQRVEIAAQWQWNDPTCNTMYYVAELPDCGPGDRLEYGVSCHRGYALEQRECLGNLKAAFRIAKPTDPARKMKENGLRQTVRKSNLTSVPVDTSMNSGMLKMSARQAALPSMAREVTGIQSFALADDVRISVSHKFMDNFVPAQPIDQHQNLLTSSDSHGKLMLLAIGSDAHGEAQVVMAKKAGGDTRGWKLVNLSQDLGSGYRAVKLAIAHDPSGAPILAGVFQQQDSPGRFHFFFTRNFAETPVRNRWISRGSANAEEIQHLATGFGFREEVLLVAAAKIGRSVDLYQIREDATPNGEPWVKLPFNVDSTGIVATAIGHLRRVQMKTDQKRRNNPSFPEYQGNAGTVLYTLTHLDGEVILYMKGLEDPSYNHRIHFEDTMSSMVLSRDPAGYSECFLGSRALYHLDAEDQRRDQVNRDKGVHVELFEEPIVNLNVNPLADGRVEVWPLLANGILYHTQRVEDSSWTVPMSLQKNVAEVATYRDPTTQALEFFPLDLNDKLSHLWRDPRTSRWQTAQIEIPNNAKAKHQSAYTTQLKLVDQRNNPITDTQVTIHTSELTTLEINGSHYFVGPHEDEAAVITPDARGIVAVVNSVSSISSPHYRVACMDQVFEIAPTEELKSKLSDMLAQGDQALLQAKTQEPDGNSKPLLKGKFATPDHAKAAHGVLTKMLSVTKKGPGAYQVPSAQRSKGRVRYSFGNRIDSSRMTSWSLDLRGSKPIFQESAVFSEAGLGVDTLSGSILGDVGDIFQAALDGVHRIEHLVVQAVEDGLKLIVNGVLHAVIQFAEQVWSAVDWFFKDVLGIDLEALLKWLGFIFGWGDILKTKQAYVKVFDSGLDQITRVIQEAETHVDQFFAMIEEKLVGKNLAEKLGDHGSQPATDGNGPANILMDLLTGGNPAVDWIFSKVKDLNLFKEIEGGIAGDFGQVVKKIEHIFTRLLREEFEDMQDTVQASVRFVIENLTQLSISQVLEQVLKILAAGLLEMTKDAVLAFLDIVMGIVKSVKKILNQPLKIPFLSALYKDFIDPGNELTALSLASLVLAIPSTIIFKIATGQAPFKDGSFNPPQWRLQEPASAFQSKLQAKHSDEDLFDCEGEAFRWSFFFGGIAVGLGRIYTNILNGIMVWNGPDKDNPAFDWALQRLAGQKILSTSITFFSSMTNLTMAIYCKGYKKPFAKTIGIAQAAFPCLAILAYVNLFREDKKKREESMVLSSAFGGFNIILFLVLFLVESETMGRDEKQDRDWKLAENLLLGLSQLGAIYPIFAKTPRLKLAGMTGFILLGLGTGGINIGRAYEHYKAGKFHNVI